MTLQKSLITSVCAVALLAMGPALAQEPSGISSELERTATTTPAEKIAYATQANTEIRDAEVEISKLLEAAKRDSDVEAIQCITSRLTQVRALKQVSEGAALSMKDAIANGLNEKADHEFRKIAVAVSQTRSLLAEAHQCSSDESLKTGETSIDIVVVDDGAEPDLTGNDIDDTDIGFDPPDVSPF